MEEQGERMYSAYSFMTSVLGGGEWSASRSCFTTGERRLGTRGWVSLRASLDTEVRGKVLCICRGSNLNRLVIQSVAKH
jgi:hypothetical protein